MRRAPPLERKPRDCPNCPNTAAPLGALRPRPAQKRMRSPPPVATQCHVPLVRLRPIREELQGGAALQLGGVGRACAASEAHEQQAARKDRVHRVGQWPPARQEQHAQSAPPLAAPQRGSCNPSAPGDSGRLGNPRGGRGRPTARSSQPPPQAAGPTAFDHAGRKVSASFVTGYDAMQTNRWPDDNRSTSTYGGGATMGYR